MKREREEEFDARLIPLVVNPVHRKSCVEAGIDLYEDLVQSGSVSESGIQSSIDQYLAHIRDLKQDMMSEKDWRERPTAIGRTILLEVQKLRAGTRYGDAMAGNAEENIAREIAGFRRDGYQKMRANMHRVGRSRKTPAKVREVF